MITAREARELAGVSYEKELEEQLELVYEKIRIAAKKKLRTVVLSDKFWVNGAYKQSRGFVEASTKLKNNGFDVIFYTNPTQPINMYVSIEW